MHVHIKHCIPLAHANQLPLPRFQSVAAGHKSVSSATASVRTFSLIPTYFCFDILTFGALLTSRKRFFSRGSIACMCCVEGLRWVGKKLSPIIASPASSTLTLRCPAAGDPSPNITWLKDAEPLVERYMGSVSCRLMIVSPIVCALYYTGCIFTRLHHRCRSSGSISRPSVSVLIYRA